MLEAVDDVLRACTGVVSTNDAPLTPLFPPTCVVACLVGPIMHPQQERRGSMAALHCTAYLLEHPVLICREQGIVSR